MLLTAQAPLGHSQPTPPSWLPETIAKLEQQMGAALDANHRARLARGLRQVARFWRQTDGDAAAFGAFVRRHFAGDQAALDTMFNRLESNFEQLFGHLNKISLELKAQAELDRGPALPFDEIFAGYDLSAHVTADFFDNGLAAVVLLNFPLKTLDECLAEGTNWSRRQWAEVRLAQRFSKRVPAEVNLAIARAGAEADQYIAQYNIWMHHLVDANGQRLFPPKLRLISHWNLRDELKANYASQKDGLARQRLLQQVMERIVTQTIPAVVVNNPHVDWDPVANTVKPAAAVDADTPAPANLAIADAPEPDTRYQKLLNCFLAAKALDPYAPLTPTMIARRFEEDRQIPERRVKAMLEQVLASPLRAPMAKLIQQRLGRPLEPFDIWYSGFVSQGPYTEPQLDQIVRTKYPSPEAYEKDMPNLLRRLGFSTERAKYLAEHIQVDPSRGSGHAWGAAMRAEKAHLRTRVEKGGMNYKGFNIAVHEMGHNVEQVCSLNLIDHYSLSGVPNNACTEALAFVFQARDRELLGLAKPSAQAEALKTLNDFWATCEIAGVGLVDMAVWHWMYDHPNATPAQLKAATIQIGKDVWNQHYAGLFQRRDVVLLPVYSHLIQNFLYLPDYPIGHLIAAQIEARIKQVGNLGVEFERMARTGNVTPDLWMQQAAGAPVGPEALLAATQQALDTVASKTSK
jgi:hypothetical protein